MPGKVGASLDLLRLGLGLAIRLTLYGHFGPWTLRHQDTLALVLKDTLALVLNCPDSLQDYGPGASQLVTRSTRYSLKSCDELTVLLNKDVTS